MKLTQKARGVLVQACGAARKKGQKHHQAYERDDVQNSNASTETATRYQTKSSRDCSKLSNVSETRGYSGTPGCGRVSVGWYSGGQLGRKTLVDGGCVCV